MAVAVCGQPHALLGVLQQTIPPQIYALLLQVRQEFGTVFDTIFHLEEAALKSIRFGVLVILADEILLVGETTKSVKPKNSKRVC